MRTFLAVDVDSTLNYEIQKIQDELKKTAAPLKLVEPENLHFTFKFFGEISSTQTEEIIQVTQDVLDNYKSFPLNIKGTGVFPSMGYMRVIWLGVEEPEQFSQLQRDLDQEFTKMGFKKERSYIPHLTIARVKGPRNKDVLAETVKKMESIEIGQMTLEKIVLKTSELTPVGPIYTDIQQFFI
ncbi:MAG: 2,3-cyclic 3-phosphodiesterase [Methanobacterium sp.]|jgi:2'-5' RNA ligase|uniref:RNA 2',3'-cyclic phosphodiesterase n=1 Tax=Methanobacterium sp. TaxID=2164 RepID=UPI0003C9EBC0|nr:RNA 2',3'-cyclic phosphodiesterase [Methanobacterium sp.]MDI3549578.1 2,3-cyclic 3-phosphodiesterase [Methanobacterium sp.]CDG65173.1 UPF0097 protein [Methanobacterium sp. MB1]